MTKGTIFYMLIRLKSEIYLSLVSLESLFNMSLDSKNLIIGKNLIIVIYCDMSQIYNCLLFFTQMIEMEAVVVVVIEILIRQKRTQTGGKEEEEVEVEEEDLEEVSVQCLR